VKPERKGRSTAEVCTSAARKTGETPCAARSGQSPLARLVFLIGVRQHAWISGSALRAGNRQLTFSPALRAFLFSLGVFRGTLYWRERSEIMEPDKPKTYRYQSVLDECLGDLARIQNPPGESAYPCVVYGGSPGRVLSFLSTIPNDVRPRCVLARFWKWPRRH
jgi:hypothetical protein